MTQPRTGRGIYHNTDIERAVLGAVLLQPERGNITLMSDEDFSDARLRKIARAIMSLDAHDTTPDYITVCNELERTGELAGVGGAAAVSALTEASPAVAMLSTHIMTLRKLTAARHLKLALLSASDALDAGRPVGDVGAEVAQAGADATQTKPVETSVGDIYEEIEKWQAGQGGGYIPSGFPSLDAANAPEPGNLVVVGARPSIGKSMLLINIAERMAANGNPVLIVSAEMTAKAIQLRRMARETGYPAHSLRSAHGIPDDAWNVITTAANAVKKRPVIVRAERPNLQQLLAAGYNAVAQHKVRAIMIDYLGLVYMPRADRHDLAIGMVTSALVELAKRTGTVIYLAVQLNREADKGPEGPRKPRLSDLRDSGMIEQDADKVWLLWRPARYESCAPNVQDLEVLVAKDREGPAGNSIILDADISCGKITDKEDRG